MRRRIRHDDIFRLNKVIFIDKNYRSEIEIFEKIIVIIQLIVSLEYFWIDEFVDELVARENELYLLKNIEFEYKINDVINYIRIYFDRDWNSEKNKIFFVDNRAYVKRILNIKLYTIRFFYYIYLTRVKIKDNII